MRMYETNGDCGADKPGCQHAACAPRTVGPSARRIDDPTAYRHASGRRRRSRAHGAVRAACTVACAVAHGAVALSRPNKILAHSFSLSLILSFSLVSPLLLHLRSFLSKRTFDFKYEVFESQQSTLHLSSTLRLFIDYKFNEKVVKAK